MTRPLSAHPETVAHREKRHARRRAGLCARCDEAPLPGLVHCPLHHEATRNLRARTRARRKRAGRCARCRAQAVPGRDRCHGHLVAGALYSAEYRRRTNP